MAIGGDAVGDASPASCAQSPTTWSTTSSPSAGTSSPIDQPDRLLELIACVPGRVKPAPGPRPRPRIDRSPDVRDVARLARGLQAGRREITRGCGRRAAAPATWLGPSRAPARGWMRDGHRCIGGFVAVRTSYRPYPGLQPSPPS